MGHDSPGHSSPPSLSVNSNGNSGDGGFELTTDQLPNLKPTTSSDSKMVVLAAERGDRIDIVDVVDHFREGQFLPSEVTVVNRNSTYYGPKLLVHGEVEDKDCNYMINAPGPASELMLWGAETDEDNYRTGWYRLAEIKGVLAENQPSYKVCSQCKSPIHSVEHERMAALGICDQGSE